MYYFYAKTLKGLNKSHNDDCFFINEFVENAGSHKLQTNKNTFIVGLADGVGGSSFGGYAAKYLMEKVSNNRKILTHPLILNSIKNTHSFLRKEFSGTSQTVMTLMHCHNELIHVYHIGDTRLYKVTDRNLIQLTTDHTYVQDLVDRGIISSEMKNFHPNKNIIKQALGGENDLKIDTYQNSFEPGERLLLTTDGIHDYLSTNDIKNIFKSSLNIQKNVDDLIHTAQSNGSKDDITAIVIRHR